MLTVRVVSRGASRATSLGYTFPRCQGPTAQLGSKARCTEMINFHRPPTYYSVLTYLLAYSRKDLNRCTFVFDSPAVRSPPRRCYCIGSVLGSVLGSVRVCKPQHMIYVCTVCNLCMHSIALYMRVHTSYIHALHTHLHDTSICIAPYISYIYRCLPSRCCC